MFSAGTLVGSLHGRAFYDSLLAGLSPLLMPFLVGNVLLGIVSASLLFLVLRSILARRKRSASA